MSALAMILAKSGYSISGSDNKKSSLLTALSSNKINIFESQKAINIDKIIKFNNKNKKIVVALGGGAFVNDEVRSKILNSCVQSPTWETLETNKEH